MNELIFQLRQLPEFRVVMEECRKARPTVPPYSPSDTMESEEATIRQIKDLSAQQKGFDLLWVLLMGKGTNGRE